MTLRHAGACSCGLVLCLLWAASALAAEPTVASPRIKLPTVVKWMLQASEPCPNCDASQTWVGRKPTPLPSPLPAKDRHHSAESMRRQPSTPANPLDEMPWSQVQTLLPVGLRGK